MGNKMAANDGSGKSPDENQNHMKLNPMDDTDPQFPMHEAGSEKLKNSKEENSFLLIQEGFVTPAIGGDSGETISNAVFCSKRLVHMKVTQHIGFMLINAQLTI